MPASAVPNQCAQPSLSENAATLLRVALDGPRNRLQRSRDLRHVMPHPVSRRAFAKAWRELAERGLLCPERTESVAL